MENYKFLKCTKKVVCLLLYNNLCLNDIDLISKISEIIELFYKEDQLLLCTYNEYKNDKFTEALEISFGEKIKTIYTKKSLFSRNIYRKKQISLSNADLQKIIMLAINYNASPCINVSNMNGITYYEIVFNDNDGTFINFNSEIFDVNIIKNNVNKILNN